MFEAGDVDSKVYLYSIVIIFDLHGESCAPFHHGDVSHGYLHANL